MLLVLSCHSFRCAWRSAQPRTGTVTAPGEAMASLAALSHPQEPTFNHHITHLPPRSDIDDPAVGALQDSELHKTPGGMLQPISPHSRLNPASASWKWKRENLSISLYLQAPLHVSGTRAAVLALSLTPQHPIFSRELCWLPVGDSSPALCPATSKTWILLQSHSRQTSTFTQLAEIIKTS